MSGFSPAISVEISPGELIDKLTILAIKRERIADKAKLANILEEYATLEGARRALPASPELAALEGKLKAINERLWQIEDDIRRCEAESRFGDEFVALARSVYKTNDRRAAIKKQIDMLVGARFSEEKSYAG